MRVAVVEITSRAEAQKWEVRRPAARELLRAGWLSISVAVPS
jgi:hypothetical protein